MFIKSIEKTDQKKINSLHITDDFQRAKEKLKAAEEKSDLATDDEVFNGKRVRIQKRRWTSESEDEVSSLPPFPRCPSEQSEPVTPVASGSARPSIENSGNSY